MLSIPDYLRYDQRMRLLLLLFFFSCRHSSSFPEQYSVPEALWACSSEYHVEGLSYLVGVNGQIIGEHAAAGGDRQPMHSSPFILSHFVAPLLLDRMIRDSLVHDRDSITPWLRARDLINVPACYYERDTASKDAMTERIRQLITKHKYVRPGGDILWMKDQLTMNAGMTSSTLLRELWNSSVYFDKTHPEYAFTDKRIYNVFPTWYTRGLSGFFGWRILKFQRQTILWNSFVDGPNSLLVMKLMDKHIFVAVAYTTGHLFSPTGLNRTDLLQSPLALSILSTVYLRDLSFDYSQPADSMYARIKGAADVSYQFLYRQQLLAHARLYQQAGLETKAKLCYSVLTRMTGDSLWVRYENQPVLSEINYVSDNLDAAVPFTLSRPSALQVFTGAQLRPRHDYSNESYLFDNVQLFINDHAGDKNNSWLNTHLFQFNYGDSMARQTPAAFETRDLSDTGYLIEARIEWKKLNPVRHTPGRVILANILIGDCDLKEDQRKSVLSWAVAPQDNFADEKKYGRILLRDQPPAQQPAGSRERDEKVIQAYRSARPPFVDGGPEDVWEKIPWTAVHLPYMGTTSQKDNAGRFKAMYDKDYLYLLFSVTDNCRNRYGVVTADKCWIENAVTGLPVWKLNGNRTDTLPGFSRNERIKLPAGQYLLRYTSDKGHSYEQWYGQPPANGIYGASIYLIQ